MYSKAVAVTPHDTTPLPDTTRAIYAAVQGDIAVTMAGGGNLTFTASARVVYPLMVSHILSTGTTATGIIALW